MLLGAGCEDGDDVLAPVSTPPVSRVMGTVISSVTGDPVAGAEVSVGAVTVTTGTDGRFELPGLVAGLATLRCAATGFEDFGVYFTLPAGNITRNITLAPLAVGAAGLRSDESANRTTSRAEHFTSARR